MTLTFLPINRLTSGKKGKLPSPFGQPVRDIL